MARFRGTVQGGRGVASRLGHKSCGLTMRANSHNGRVTVRLFTSKQDEDYANVYLEDTNGKHWLLYYGPVAKYVNPRLKNIEFIPLWDGKQEKK